MLALNSKQKGTIAMGRQAAYERVDVLDKASKVFLRNGFKHTTIKDITKATGLQPGSIYSAFENKNGLYTEVIDHFTKRQISILDDCVKQNGNSIQALRAFFKIASENITHQTPDAHCILIFGAFEIPRNEKKLRYYIKLKLKEIEARIDTLLVKAQENNEILDSEKPNELASFLMALLCGYRVMGRLQMSPEASDKFVERMFQVLESKGK